jgi:hypothetical protein
MKSSKLYFSEEQKFDQWWIKLFIFGATIAAVGPMYYGTIQQLSAGKPWGDNPMSDSGLIIMDLVTTVIMVGVIYLVFSAKLITTIKQDGIYIRYKPFLYKDRFIPVEDIEKFEVRKYNPVREYGGWGVKHGKFGRGRAYNVKGNRGLQLWLKGDKKLLIGTQRSEAVKRAMNKMMDRYE